MTFLGITLDYLTFMVLPHQPSKESASNAGTSGDVGSIPGSGRSLGGGHGNPLQYSCLEKPMDREAWRATVHRVTESDTTEATYRISSLLRHFLFVCKYALLTVTRCQTPNFALLLLQAFQQPQQVCFITFIFQMRAPSFRIFK